jgi:hypothetical protein
MQLPGRIEGAPPRLSQSADAHRTDRGHRRSGVGAGSAPDWHGTRSYQVKVILASARPPGWVHRGGAGHAQRCGRQRLRLRQRSLYQLKGNLLVRRLPEHRKLEAEGGASSCYARRAARQGLGPANGTALATGAAPFC